MLDREFRVAADAARARWELPALCFGVSVGGRREQLALGCDEDARFRVASVTKPFTATLALGALDPDAQVGVWPGVTVRHLLSHTSGYDCELGDLHRFGTGDDALPRVAAELPAVRRWTEPGRVWSYSNAGYWLAGHLVSQAVGATFEAALHRLVLEPAGLEATDFDEPDLDGFDADPATGALTRNDDGSYPRARRPSGGLVSTVGDLLRFAERQLADPAAAALRVPVAGRPGGSYGLGYMLDLAGGHEVWLHGGSYGGFQSVLGLVPERGVAFVGLTNSGTGAHVLEALEDELLERTLGVRREPPPTVSRPAGELEAVAGTYENDETRVEVVAASDGPDQQVAVDGPASALRARPLPDGEFEVVDGPSAGSRFDFPLPGFVRFSSRLAARVRARRAT